MNTQNTILVSTITPAFRMKKYLKKFLEELPKQTIFSNLEVVLDHNEPDAEEITWVQDFQKKYPGKIKHLIVDKVDPIGTSMNRCIKEASGDYVTIWNVDDLRTPNSIESQYNALKNNPEYGATYGDYIVVRSFGATTGSLVKHSPTISKTELTRSMSFGPFYMFKKSLVETAGYFDEQLTSGADFDLAIRLAFNTKAIMTKELLGYYLNEGLGASTRPNSKQPIDRTVIELRYGIFDKIDYDYLPNTVTYNVPFIKEFRNFNNVDRYVPDYAALIVERKKKWFKKGMRNYVVRKIFFVKDIKNLLKKVVKPVLRKLGK